ncbi:hypothetical protein HPP92_014657 [Vanilla planifolia]|uniref:Pseudouridine synthase RsuA/RluA-like domain-containing protein n=1 Tax=Vanilla planifolia TaxID=51239 RepID=A0A835UX37_VANPL|nr:hypothetical protein HPP92_014657 [Vanilla planifolia]
MEIIWQTPANPPEVKDYIFVKGKRYVMPYYFEFIAHVKNRWEGKTIVDLFAEEFRGRTYEYYVRAVKNGRIKVDDQMVPVSYILQSSQKISHFVHRHEPPVLAGKVSILQTESDVITVCKPASIPVHPCGQYRKNTVVGILQAEHGLAPLFPIHRLDRLVSGLLIFARNANKAEQFRRQIDAGLLEKEYIARVIGIFPDGEHAVNANLCYNAREGRTSVEIRAHLQYTGYPIANDKLYPSKPMDHLVKGTGTETVAFTGKDQWFTSVSSSDNRITEAGNWNFAIDPMCTNCPGLAPTGYDGEEEGIWLHCVRYSGPGWSYECPFPKWAFFH